MDSGPIKMLRPATERCSWQTGAVRTVWPNRARSRVVILICMMLIKLAGEVAYGRVFKNSLRGKVLRSYSFQFEPFALSSTNTGVERVPCTSFRLQLHGASAPLIDAGPIVLAAKASITMMICSIPAVSPR